jgi:hypothetical protein
MRLRALPQEIAGSATEDQEASRSLAAVGQHSQDREQVGAPLDLVDDDEAGERLEGGAGLIQPGEAHRVFEVEVVGRVLGKQLASQGGFARLARPGQHGDRAADEGGPNPLQESRAGDRHAGKIP